MKILEVPVYHRVGYIVEAFKYEAGVVYDGGFGILVMARAFVYRGEDAPFEPVPVALFPAEIVKPFLDKGTFIRRPYCDDEHFALLTGKTGFIPTDTTPTEEANTYWQRRFSTEAAFAARFAA